MTRSSGSPGASALFAAHKAERDRIMAEISALFAELGAEGKTRVLLMLHDQIKRGRGRPPDNVENALVLSNYEIWRSVKENGNKRDFARLYYKQEAANDAKRAGLDEQSAYDEAVANKADIERIVKRLERAQEQQQK